MKLKRMALALSMCCSLALVTACQTVRSVEPLRPDKTYPERFACQAAGARPAIPAEYVIDWSKVLVAGDANATLVNAEREHAAYVASIRTREGAIAGYIVRIEGQLFACSNNVQWLRDFYAGLDQK